MKEAGQRLFAGDRTAPARVTVLRATAEALWSEAAQDLVAPAVHTIDPTLEQQIIELLDAPASFGERASAAFHRKEHQIGGLFATLSAADSRALHRRLTVQSADDPIAKRFGRLVIERRTRLVAFLADAPRRAAIARSRR